MTDLRDIAVDDVELGTRLRKIDDAQVEAIKASVLNVGLLNPITVYPRSLIRGGQSYEGFGLVAGAHRLEAYRRIGYAEIPANVVDLSDLERQIAECDENLCGTQLSPSDRARFVKRRKDAYEALHPETRRQATLKQGENSPSRQVGDTGKADRFTADTSARTGQSERAIQRDAERGSKVIDEALELLRATRLDTGSYLDKLKRLPPNEQIHAVKRDLAADRKPRHEPKQETRGGISSRYGSGGADPASKVFERFVSLVDELEVLSIGDLVTAAGRKRSVLAQRASGLIDRLTDILARADQ